MASWGPRASPAEAGQTWLTPQACLRLPGPAGPRSVIVGPHRRAPSPWKPCLQGEPPRGGPATMCTQLCARVSLLEPRRGGAGVGVGIP